MEINITKEALNVNKVVCEKKEIINIQGDMIVPDSKPDILNTINTSGNVCIYKKEVMDGKIKIDGNILAYIMYLADSNADNEANTDRNATNSIEGGNRTDNIRGLNTNLDFSENQFNEKTGFYKGSVDIDEPYDTFLKLENFKKGFVTINGFNIGRYWEIGPQKTLYVPKSILQKGENEFIVFESDGLKGIPQIELCDVHDLGENS